MVQSKIEIEDRIWLAGLRLTLILRRNSVSLIPTYHIRRFQDSSSRAGSRQQQAAVYLGVSQIDSTTSRPHPPAPLFAVSTMLFSIAKVRELNLYWSVLPPFN